MRFRRPRTSTRCSRRWTTSAPRRARCLDLDKLVARRKTELKEEAIATARRALDAHIAALNAELAPMRVAGYRRRLRGRHQRD